jgi:cell division protein FtsW (lipid II flippase)
MKIKFLIAWMVILCLGFVVANYVLSNNLELIEQFLLIKDGQIQQTVKHITSDESIPIEDAVNEAYRFLYWSYGMLSITSVLFAFLVARRMTTSSDSSLRVIHKTLNQKIAFILLGMLVLVLAGYSVQLGLQDPLHGSDKIYGQPARYYFGVQANLWSLTNLRTNPFIFPSVVFLWASVLLVGLYGSSYLKGTQRFSGLLARRETKIKHLWIEHFPDKTPDDFVSMYTEVVYNRWFVFSVVSFCAMLLMESVFSGGVTFIEAPKIALFVGLSGLVTHKVQQAKDNPELQQVQRLFIGVFGVLILFVMTALFYLLNDLGAILIVAFVVLLVCYSVVFKDAVWKLGLGLYGSAILLKNIAPEWFVSAKERLADWTLSDYFITSGIGDTYVPGTASSTDFAKALWGIAAGGWTGRGTGLFALEGKDEPYVASMAFGYNDRAGSALIEIFGWLGLVSVMVVFLIVILNMLLLYRIPQQKFYPRYGVALGAAAFFFGQVVVHFGGNFGFIPFTGIVLPFISHSGLSILFNISLVTILIAMYLPTNSVSDDAPVVELSSLVGMFKLVYLTVFIITLYAGYQTVLKGSNYSTRIRYDIQADNSIKKVVNPRLFLLTNRLNASGQIVDIVNAKVKNEKGEYQYSGFDESDYFLHHFEQEHEFTLKGIHQDQYKDQVYYQKICVLKDGDYHQFAGTSLSESQRKIEYFVEHLNTQSTFVDDESMYNCSVQKINRGLLWEYKIAGIPVDSTDPSKGCTIVKDGQRKTVIPFLGGGTTNPSPNHSVWYFNSDSSSTSDYLKRLEPFLQHGGSSKMSIYPIAYEDVSKETTDICVVAKWYTKLEERKGVISNGETCLVSESDGDTTLYGANSIDGRVLSKYSARGVVLSDMKFDGTKNKEASIEGEVDVLDLPVSLTMIDEVDSNVCYAQIERVGCKIHQVVLADQNDPDVVAGIASQRVYFGTNVSLGFTDTSCKVSQDTFGRLKVLSFREGDDEVLRAAKYFYEKDVEILKSEYEKDVVRLHTFAKSDVSTQLEYLSKYEDKVPETVVQIGLHAKLQSAVRNILIDHQVRLDAPSVQALVFDVRSGQILSQAQVTKPRSEYEKYLEAKDYVNLFTDRGMYGFGRNNLSNAMVPASTFKVLHALAAIEGNVTDFEHTCSSEGYLPAEAEWPCRKNQDCSISDYGQYKGYSTHNATPTGKTTLSHAITKSCNQYFAALAYEHTHPDVMTKVCQEKGLQFGRFGDCKLKSPGTRGAASNGWGQELLMDVYQMAGVLQAASMNYQPYLEPWYTYLHPEQRGKSSVSDFKPLFDGEGAELIEKYVLTGMYDQVVAQNISNAVPNVRVYGKTGTGDHNISVNAHKTERLGQYITPTVYYKGKPNEFTLWVEDYEAPYGVKRRYRSKKGTKIPSNMAVFVALVEQESSSQSKQLSDNRIGVVVRVPRSEKISSGNRSVTGGGMAGPIAQEIIVQLQQMNLIPAPE